MADPGVKQPSRSAVDSGVIPAPVSPVSPRLRAPKIFCIGNRLMAGDTAGPAVHDRLMRWKLPGHIQLIDGGTCGLNLLSHLEYAGEVVFVDTVSGFADPGQVILLEQQEICVPCCGIFDHGAGLPYLVSVLPRVCDGPGPERIRLIGLEPPCGEAALTFAARLAMALICDPHTTGEPHV